jgi:hypothetical protein
VEVQYWGEECTGDERGLVRVSIRILKTYRRSCSLASRYNESE